MEITHALVEYYYSAREGAEYPQVFAGSLEECRKVMSLRHKTKHNESKADDTYSYCYPEDNHAICMDDDGDYRYEWWIRDLKDDAEYMGVRQ